MKKILPGLAVVLLSLSARAQAPALTFTNVTGSGSITCATPSLNFVASVSNYTAPLSFLWNSASNSQSGSNVTLSSGGQYTLTAYNTAASFSLSQTFSIGTNTTAPLSIVSPTLQNISCQAPVQTVTAMASPSINITHKFYSPGGTMAAAASYTAIYNPGGPGVYTHCLVNDINGCSTCKTFTVVTSGSYPTLSVLNPSSNFTLGCGSFSTTNITLQGQANPNTGGPVTYTIVPGMYFGSGSNFGSATLLAINSPGLYTAVIKDNATQCQTSVPFSVFQAQAPDLIYYAATQTLTCYTPSVILQGASTGTNILFQWLSAAGAFTSSSYTVNATASVNSSVTGVFTLTATDLSTSCRSSSVISIYQNLFRPHISLPGSNYAVSCTTPSITLSFGASSTIPPAFPSNMPVVNVSWEGPSPQASLAISTSYTASTPGVYTVTGRDLNNGCLSNTTIVIADNRIYPVLQPLPPFACPSPTVLIYCPVSGPASGLAYSWLAPAGAVVSGVNSPSLTTDAAGAYKVIVTNQLGCTSTANVIVSACTGMRTNAAAIKAGLQPNPTSGMFTLTLSNITGDTGILIYNTLGTLVKKLQVSSEETLIDLSSEPNGIYLVYVLDKSKAVAVSKLVKQ